MPASSGNDEHLPAGFEESTETPDPFDDDLLSAFEADPRFASGVPEDHRASDVEFIQMTGITRRPAPEPPQQPPTPSDDIATSDPISFYERGVLDVDERMTPTGYPPAQAEDAELPAAPPEPETPEAAPGLPSGSAEALRQLIAELTEEESDAPLEAPADAAPEATGTPETVESEDDLDLTTLTDLLDESAAEFEAENGMDAELAALLDTVAEPATPESDAELDDTAPEAEDDSFDEWPEPEPEPEAMTTAPEAEDHTSDVWPEPEPEAEAVDDTETDAEPEPTSETHEDPLAALPGSDAPVSPPTDDDPLAGWPEFESANDIAEEPEEPEETEEAGQAPPHMARERDARLAEAEDLLRALEDQPREEGADLDTGAETTPFTPDTETPWPEGRDDIAEAEHADDPARPVSAAVRWIRRGIVVAALAAGVGGGYYAYESFAQPGTESPRALLARGHALMEAGEYAAAGEYFDALARDFPGDAAAADATFQAALATQMTPTEANGGEARDRRALALFDHFIAQHPEHGKVTRARVMAGLLAHRLGDFADAVDRLQPLVDADLRVVDPEAAAPVLRTLARCHARLDEPDTAAALYRAAAALSRNYTPEIDYYELGVLYRDRARGTPDPAQRDAFEAQAATWFERAAEVPGIGPRTRERIRDAAGRPANAREDGATMESVQ